ncbi:uncharacterized protein SPSK_04578 [Sporothrix schenckii 1099-18]|uniref:AA1-like domain-containing protein n=2 Tax=Sporothrix schenckii TaxID=29908 RepID=U7PTB7_SPOS1|nr:uncharacterized protein SPSK_04578 [Sporothrix schenckii 1099-18]ERS98852.1 hypothetical protein HMPREF1624_04042 [Sporothrix schenckii ATCC 58251]KJR83539.1 hypothetical protein SPSK_04578 [Sporothrix schenckii 1099-18]
MVRSSPRALVGLLAASAAATASAAPTVAARGDAPACVPPPAGTKYGWSIGEFVFNKSITFSTPAHQIDGGVVQFNLSNPSLAYPAVCAAYSSQLSEFFYGNIVYNCTTENPDTATAFTFNAPTGQLNVNQSWMCIDPDNGPYPTTFAYKASVDLTPACTSSSYKNPDWHMGEIYSSNTTACVQKDVTLLPQPQAEA